MGLTTARAQLLFEVTQAYYDAVLSDQLVNIAAGHARTGRPTLRQVEAGLQRRHAAGIRSLARPRESRPAAARAHSPAVNRALAYLRLKRLLDLPPEADLQLADALSDENLPPPPAFVERVSAVENALRSNDTPSLTVGGLSLPERVAIEQRARRCGRAKRR